MSGQARETTFVGIDVSKTQLEIALRPTGKHWSYGNDEEGIRCLVRRLGQYRPTLVVLEATGRLAKTEQMDAAVLALFAERVRPEFRSLPSEEVEALDALVTRRRQLIAMLTAEKNRLSSARRPVRKGIAEHIRWRQARVREVDRDLDERIRSSPLWRRKGDLLRSVPAVGPVLSRTRILVAEPLRAYNSETLSCLKINVEGRESERIDEPGKEQEISFDLGGLEAK